MAEYIEKQVAIDVVRAYLSDCCVEDGDYHASGIEYELNDLPPADVRPVVRGRWEISCDGWYPYCPVCKEEPPGRTMTPFCPMCGADMRGGDADGDKKD